MKIAVDGKACAAIMLPDAPTAREIFAAEELNRYIARICGVPLPFNTAAKNTVFIGGPTRHPAVRGMITEEEFAREVPGPEGIFIRATETALVLAGSSGDDERGTVYAVYEFLERYLGCSLAVYANAAADAGEIVLCRKTVAVDACSYIKAHCDVPYRTAIMQYSVWAGNPDHALNEQFMDWLCKNRYNRILTWWSIYEGFKKNGVAAAAEKRGIRFSVGHHESMSLFLPPKGNRYFAEKYAETHPEYYKLKPDHTRYAVRDGDFMGQLILCMRNEDGIREFAKNMIAWAKQNPLVDIITLWPSDGIDDSCCCEACRKYDKNTNYTYFVNRVADIVHAALPAIRIDRIAYIDVYQCDGTPSNPAVLIDESVWLDGNLRHVGAPDGSCLCDTKFEKELLAWKKSGASVVYYDYMMGVYNAKQRYMPMADELQAVCSRFAAMGIDGLGTQMEVYNLWNNIFNFYTYGRTAYDVSLSINDNLDRFCRLFGKGGAAVREAMCRCEAVVDGQTDIADAGKWLIQHVDKAGIYSLYDEALQKAEEKRERNNIRLMRMAFRYSDLEVTNQPENNRNGQLTDTMDENGELWYMAEHFDSFLSGKEGYGIAVPVQKCETVFTPDIWYQFE